MRINNGHKIHSPAEVGAGKIDIRLVSKSTGSAVTYL